MLLLDTCVTCYSYLGSEGSRMLLLHALHVTVIYDQKAPECYCYIHVLHVTVI